MSRPSKRTSPEVTSSRRVISRAVVLLPQPVSPTIPSLEGPRGVELVPIPGRPPSLIRRPSGCHFHPRCAYALPSHSTIDPSLTPVGDAPEHLAACLLEGAQRTAAWAQLRAGGTPMEAREAAGIEAVAVPAAEVAG